tara:strand:+ start:137 stop:394 length:258 start_codon:yes stop_codon:yes gene_type:complete
MKNSIFIFLFVLLANCSTYKPLINPESSKDKWSGNVIAGNYYKDLQACEYIYDENTGLGTKVLGLGDRTGFIKKCMNDYGYSILR